MKRSKFSETQIFSILKEADSGPLPRQIRVDNGPEFISSPKHSCFTFSPIFYPK
ncbi:hypothetical protein OAB00_00075 [Akkermansiaceae bacterium]|nr:hypothetical protein [Akkermansiaceae bacterium]